MAEPAETGGGAGPTVCDAVVLAGSFNRIPLFPGHLPGPKALLEMGGRCLIDRVLDCLLAAEGVGHCYVVGGGAVLRHVAGRKRVTGVGAGASLVRNAVRGVQAASTDRVLFCNPDQPHLRPEMVSDFLRRALEVDADLVTSWVSREDLGDYEEGARKFAAFGDGSYAHGNLFLVRRDFPRIDVVRRRMDRLYGARKNEVLFAWELGPALFVRFIAALASHRLPSLAQTLDLVGKQFGFRLAGVVSPYPEIILDIDEPHDYEAAVRRLAAASP